MLIKLINMTHLHHADWWSVRDTVRPHRLNLKHIREPINLDWLSDFYAMSPMPCAVNLSDSTLEGGDNRAEVATRTRAKLRLICVTYWAAMLQCDKFYCIPCKKQETGIFQNLLNLLCQNLIWIFLYYTHANVFYFSKISTSRVTHLFLHF